MKSDNYLFDTNVFIYYLNAFREVDQYFSIDFLKANSVFISVVTEIELLSFPQITAQEKKIILGMLKSFRLIPLSQDVKVITIGIKSKGKIKIADAIIAASAIFCNAILITRNVADFKKISKLHLIDPFSDLKN